MQANAVLFEEPGNVRLGEVALKSPADGDVVVEIRHSGISAGTERLLWQGEMPQFPGLGYPLIPGYEAVGEVVEASGSPSVHVGSTVFVPGCTSWQGARGLFGGSGERLVVPAVKTTPIDPALGESGVLLALAATAHHAISRCASQAPDLIVGHGVLGRLVNRILVALDRPAAKVWEVERSRMKPESGEYAVCRPDADPRQDYNVILDVSGDVGLLDRLVSHMALGGEIVLAGFYKNDVSFAFPPAFIKEASFRISSEFTAEDLIMVRGLVDAGCLSLDRLITHRMPASSAQDAYPIAFDDPSCLKLALDWRHAQ